MKTNPIRMLSRMGTALAAVFAVSLPASALDINNYSTPDDAACAGSAGCATPRGGVSDVMTIYKPDGTVLDRIFAFGSEENQNFYYFDSSVVDLNLDQFGDPAYLLEHDGSASDAFGIFEIVGGVYGLGFWSDQLPTGMGPGSGSTVFSEVPGANPNGWILESPYESLTIEYDATRFLSTDMQRSGYTAKFQSDVPEPASLTLLGIGALAAGSLSKRRQKAA